MIGKWHLGSDPTGFDRWEILPGQGVYQDPVLYTATGETTYRGRYVTDVITDLAIDFIRNRPKDRPFFLMCHHKAPHREWTPDGQAGQEKITAALKATLARLRSELRDDDRFADEQPPAGVDGTVAALRGK